MKRGRVSVIGAGLAGCEAALQLARRGHSVRLYEQKPKLRTPAQSSDHFCELVCSNSLRGAALSNAVGLLKQEMRELGSFVMRAADATRVPAGGALAVDRDRFSAMLTELVTTHPNVEVVAGRVDELPLERPLLVATGPLTAEALSAQLGRLVGAEHFAYYDAISPIVLAESIDWERVFLASRWDKGEGEDKTAYVNCPMSAEQYQAFVAEVLAASKVDAKPFEDARYFEGCLPIEVMAERGPRTLAFGPMKPVGLTDPRTGRWPHAVVQLRPEDSARTAYNMVGFQTRLRRGEQERIFRTIPGLERAEFVRYGAVHRNTFINAPEVIDTRLRLKTDPGLFFAGQITGTEGYVESAAGGWLASYFIAADIEGRACMPPPQTTAHGGLLTHLSRAPHGFQPSNITFSHLPPWPDPAVRKRARYEAMAERALGDLRLWRDQSAAWFGLIDEGAGQPQRETAQSAS